MKTAEPTLNQAYAMIIEDESQKSSPYIALAVKAEPTFKPSGGGDPNPMAMQAGRGQPYKGKKPFMQYDFCHKKGHTRNQCWKIVGFPSDQGGKKQYSANYAGMSGRGANQPPDEERNTHFTENQHKKILELLNNGNATPETNLEKHVNVTGKSVSLITELPYVEWIVDSGASHHIAANIDVLDSTKELSSNTGDKVCMPTGKESAITHIGSASLLVDIHVRNLLYVPEFEYNLLSVSKLTKELSCSVNFFPYFCVFQDLYSGRMRGIGRESDGLYIIRDDKHVEVKNAPSNTTTK